MFAATVIIRMMINDRGQALKISKDYENWRP